MWNDRPSRRDVLKLALGSAAVTGAMPWLASPVVAAEPTRPPNIVLFYVDDMGWRDAGFAGSGFYQTPHMDRLASQGMMFTHAYASAPNCAPSRACMLSGQYTPRHGVYTVNSSERGEARDRKVIPTPNTHILDPGIVTFAEALKQKGYATASIGKWHVGVDPQSGPKAQGFDTALGGSRAGNPRSHFSPYRTPGIPDGPEGEYLTDRLTDEAITFMRRHRDQPFLLYLTHYSVHTPIQAKPELEARYRDRAPDGGQRRADYAAMVDSTDQSLGRVLATLDELGLADSTLVVFTSDNGGYGPATSNAPLRGAKGTIHEGGIRVPLLVRWPGRVKPGSVSHEPVVSVDFYPTLLEAAGAEAPDQPLDGESLVPVLTGAGQLQRDAIWWHLPVYLDPNLPEDGLWRLTPCTAMRQGDWKLVAYYEDDRVELYNLQDDVSERRDLSDKMPERAAAMREAMDAWRTRMGVPTTLPRNPEYRPREGVSQLHP